MGQPELPKKIRADILRTAVLTKGEAPSHIPAFLKED